MELTVGFPELIGAGITMVGGGWSLLKLSLNQFETRLGEKFKVLDTAVNDVKRIELDIVRSDTRNAQMYVTKVDHDKILERIFKVLESMDEKLSDKPSHAEVREKVLYHMGKDTQ